MKEKKKKKKKGNFKRETRHPDLQSCGFVSPELLDRFIFIYRLLNLMRGSQFYLFTLIQVDAKLVGFCKLWTSIYSKPRKQ